MEGRRDRHVADPAAVTGGNGSCTQLEELWLEAQSVPSASRIPCVQAFPGGVVGTLAVRDGESVLELEDDEPEPVAYAPESFGATVIIDSR